MKSPNSLFTIAGISGALTVILGAFGAHGLEKMVSERMLEVFNIGVRYQMYHSLALLAVANLPADPDLLARIYRACWAWIIGMIVFSGSLYLLALTEVKWLGMITPFGGVAFIAGWVMLINWKRNPSQTVNPNR